MGLMRGLDQFRTAEGKDSMSARGVALVDCGGGDADRCFNRAATFRALGYRTAILRDGEDMWPRSRCPDGEPSELDGLRARARFNHTRNANQVLRRFDSSPPMGGGVACERSVSAKRAVALVRRRRRNEIDAFLYPSPCSWTARGFAPRAARIAIAINQTAV